MADERQQTEVSITVNGSPISASVEPRLLLIDFLRSKCNLTGAHVGCEEGACGACTVEVDGVLVKSCLMFAVQADGREVTTVEGLARNGHLHPVQEAFRTEYALQCGYCTPGMVMAAQSLLKQADGTPSEEEIRMGMMGNICRCGGYQNIMRAIQTAATTTEGAS